MRISEFYENSRIYHLYVPIEEFYCTGSCIHITTCNDINWDHEAPYQNICGICLLHKDIDRPIYNLLFVYIIHILQTCTGSYVHVIYQLNVNIDSNKCTCKYVRLRKSIIKIWKCNKIHTSMILLPVEVCLGILMVLGRIPSERWFENIQIYESAVIL